MGVTLLLTDDQTPKPHMPLSDDEQITVAKHVERHTGGECPACGGTELDLHAEPMAMRLIANGALQPNSVAALVAVSCETCYHVMTFNATKLDIDVLAA